jgi:UDP-N-acetylglucosamine 2-epimerase (non-hydrolysing)
MTVTRGTNRVVGTDARRIVPELHEVLAAAMPARPSLPLWDGLAASRVVEILEDEVRSGRIGANVAPAVS